MQYAYRSYSYRGLTIHENNKGSRFNTPYYSVIYFNKKDGREYHVHTSSLKYAKKVVDCFYGISSGRSGMYSLGVRNKACRLLGQYILSK